VLERVPIDPSLFNRTRRGRGMPSATGREVERAKESRGGLMCSFNPRGEKKRLKDIQGDQNGDETHGSGRWEGGKERGGGDFE